MEEKESYSADEVREMFEAYEKYRNEIASVELVKYGVTLLEQLGQGVQGQMSDVVLMKKEDIEKALADCREKMPHSLLKKLGIAEREKNVRVINTEPGKKYKL